MCPLCQSEHIEVRYSVPRKLEFENVIVDRIADDCYCFTCKQFYTEYTPMKGARNDLSTR